MKQQVDKVVLEGSVRAATGKGIARGLRHEGLIPGVMYAEGVPAVSIQLSVRDLNKVLHTKAGTNVLIALCLQKDSKSLPENLVLVKELQHHPVSHQVIHVDFHKVSLTKEITVTVSLSFKGEPAGVKRGEGVLEHLRWDLEVSCLPTQIPAEIPVDVSTLDMDQTLWAKNIPLPEGVRLVTDGDLPVAACVKPRQEEIAAPAAEAGAEAVEPEVIKQKKPEELAAEGEAQAKEKPAKDKEEKKK